MIEDTKTIVYPDVQINDRSTGGNPYNTALSYNDRRFMNALVAT